MAKKVKEMYSYVCPDIVKEFAKYDKQPEKYFKTFSGTKVKRAKEFLFYIFEIASSLETYWAAVDLRCGL